MHFTLSPVADSSFPIGRLDGFFKVLPKTEEQVAAQKRKNAEKLEERKKKQKQEAAAKKGAKARPKGTS